MNKTLKQVMAVSCASLMVSILGDVALAQAVPPAAPPLPCIDFYQTYINQATTPAPVLLVPIEEEPHFHDYHPHYRGHDVWADQRDGRGDHRDHHRGDNHDNNGNADAIAAGVVAAVALGAITTSAVEDAKLRDAENVRDAINEAQIGGGTALADLTSKVQANAKPGITVTEAEVAEALIADNDNATFCPSGDLMSESELASYIATQMGIHK